MKIKENIIAFINISFWICVVVVGLGSTIWEFCKILTPTFINTPSLITQVDYKKPHNDILLSHNNLLVDSSVVGESPEVEPIRYNKPTYYKTNSVNGWGTRGKCMQSNGRMSKSRKVSVKW
jgi:hypothetical protein